MTVRTVRSSCAAALRRQQQVERLRRGDEDVRRRAQDRRALGRGRVAGADGRRDARRVDAARLGELPDAAPRLRQVLVDVGAQRLERRDVDDADFIRERRRPPLRAPGRRWR